MYVTEFCRSSAALRAHGNARNKIVRPVLLHNASMVCKKSVELRLIPRDQAELHCHIWRMKLLMYTHTSKEEELIRVLFSVHSKREPAR